MNTLYMTPSKKRSKPGVCRCGNRISIYNLSALCHSCLLVRRKDPRVIKEKRSSRWDYYIGG
jgi:hypothetical protein